jgi:hypothetical protein
MGGAPYWQPPQAAAYAGGAAVPRPPYPPGQYGTKQWIGITSLVLGCVGFVTCGVVGIGAISGLVLGIVGTVKAKRYPAEYGAKGMAIAGIVLNGTCLILTIAYFSMVAATLGQLGPNLAQAQMMANEASAISSLRQIAQAEEAYRSTEASGRRFGDLSQLASAGLIPSDLSSGQLGYRFEARPRTIGSGDHMQYTFEAFATPSQYNSTGKRSFYVSETNVVRAADRAGLQANSADPPLQYGTVPQGRPGGW